MLKPSQAMLAASQWYAKLASGEASEHDFSAWKSWKDATIENQQAWRQLEEINQQFKQLPPKVGLNTLQKPVLARRQALKNLAVIMGVGSVSYYAYREQPWREMLADYKTALGESREVQLADGTQLYLNTNSAINVQYINGMRQIELLEGEILVKTGHQPIGDLNLTVKTPHGLVTALGTQFSVRNVGDYSKVSLFEGVVEVAPNGNQQQAVVLKVGESINFTIQQVSRIGIVKRTDMAWTNGLLVAYAMPLNQFVAELSRYHKGVLRCDPTIAQLAISGTFPIRNTDKALDILTSTLPVRVHTVMGYWTTIQAI